MNRFTVGNVRKMKDGQGHYQWQPSSQLGQPATFLGYPIADDDNMPDVANAAYPAAFGDFKRGYIIVDRVGVRVLRDPYTSKPNVLFYTTKRVGGGVQNFEAIKLLKITG
jgi:HK97 family phage major capsid protein